jgi:SAM-dependent methyltransferase
MTHIDDVTGSTAEFWEGFYQDRDKVWSGNPNPLLVREAAGLAPGTALDLGCGEGGDAIWLARQGWRVTAVDVSEVALRRAAGHAAEAGVGEAVEWARHDLARSFPQVRFDLVSAQFFHSPVAEPGEWERVLRRAAEAVAPGGVLVIGNHVGWPSWVDKPDHDVRFPTVAELLAALGFDKESGAESGWQVEVAETVEREMTGPEGQHGHRQDLVIRARRLA